MLLTVGASLCLMLAMIVEVHSSIFFMAVHSRDHVQAQKTTRMDDKAAADRKLLRHHLHCRRLMTRLQAKMRKVWAANTDEDAQSDAIAALFERYAKQIDHCAESFTGAFLVTSGEDNASKVAVTDEVTSSELDVANEHVAADVDASEGNTDQ